MRYRTILIFSFLILLSKYDRVHSQTVTDIDGNIYHTATIGSQTWMVENLKTTKYRNGDLIGTTTPGSLDISIINGPRYQWSYDNKESNINAYGRLYTWYAVSDSRGICPIGWHVSTDADWSSLMTFLGGETVAFSKLKESGSSHWIKYDTGTNELGFGALPGGLRNGSGSFVDIGYRGNWWTSTEVSTYDAWYRFMDYSFNNVNRQVNLKRNGMSVRCIKN
jgi:uncharacterized protein (TIGR02145 family)